MGNLWNEYAYVATVLSLVTTGGTNTSRPNFVPCCIDQQHSVIYVVLWQAYFDATYRIIHETPLS